MTGWNAGWGSDPGAMASRRDRARHRSFWLAMAGLLVTVLLAAAIQLGNSVTELRREIEDLTLQQENLVARHATLSLAWNRATSRQVVMRRATSELGLVCPEDPGTVMLTRHAPPPQPGHWDRLRRHLPLDDPAPSALAGVIAP
jgi:hypothetical protein